MLLKVWVLIGLQYATCDWSDSGSAYGWRNQEDAHRR